MQSTLANNVRWTDSAPTTTSVPRKRRPIPIPTRAARPRLTPPPPPVIRSKERQKWMAGIKLAGKSLGRWPDIRTGFIQGAPLAHHESTITLPSGPCLRADRRASGVRHATCCLQQRPDVLASCALRSAAHAAPAAHRMPRASP